MSDAQRDIAAGAPPLPAVPDPQAPAPPFDQEAADAAARAEAERIDAEQAAAAAAAPPVPEPAVQEQASAGAPVARPGTPAQATVAMPASPVQAPEASRPEAVPDNWPQQGYDGPQPWEVENPPDLTHDRGIIISGSAGAAVVELAACLAHVGIGTSISEGGNVHAIYGPTEAAAVQEFCRVYGVAEDPVYVRAGGPGVVGPWIWEALFRAVRNG
jgi:hypothetical protein